MQLSIIIPIYNEEKFLQPYLTDLFRRLNKTNYKFELILSENGSTDKTRQLAHTLAKIYPQITIITSPKPNYGLAVKKGFLKAQGKYLVLFDLDYYHLGFLRKALKKMDTLDAVVASKRSPTAIDQRSPARRLATLVFSFILQTMFSLKISDTHGMKVLKRKKFLKLIKKTKFTKEIFDTELLIRGQMSGLKLGEIGVKVVEKRQSRSSIVARSLRTLKDLLFLKVTLLTQDQ